MSRKSIPLVDHNFEDSERASHRSNTNVPDDKHNLDVLLGESKRLIKTGHYKKAFNLVEGFKHEMHISPIANMKLCRRMVICTTKIMNRYLVKGEMQRPDHFLKLKQKSWEYLQTWHDFLTKHIAKTNPKFSHLATLFDDVAETIQSEPDGLQILRAKSRKETNGSFNNTSITNLGDTKASFMGKTKNINVSTSKDRKAGYLEDTIQSPDLEARAAAGGTSAQTAIDFNVGYHLDEFIKYFLITIMSWGEFYKKVMRKYSLTYKLLKIALTVCRTIGKCLNPELLQIIAKVKLNLAILYCEFGKEQEAIDLLESAVNYVQTELSLRINENAEDVDKKNEYSVMQRLKSTVRLFIVILMNMSTAYELKDQYARAVESLKLGSWFASKYMGTDEEITQAVNSCYNLASLKYDRFLKEIAEAERMTGNRETLPPTNPEQEKTDNTHFEKINSHIYNKFGYEKLNSSQVIVLSSSITADQNTSNYHNTSNYQNRTEITQEGIPDANAEPKYSWFKPKDATMDASAWKLSTVQDGHESPRTMVSWKLNSMTLNKSGAVGKEKKKKNMSFMTEELESRMLTSKIYRTKNMSVVEDDQIDLNSEEEKEYIQKLNRNIKDRHKKQRRKNIKANEFLDVDRYFGQVVDQKIKDEEKEMHVKTIDFKSTIKNYAKFLKTEAFDDREFGFAKRTLVAKSRENLSGYGVEGNKKQPSLKAAEVNEFKVDAQHLEAQFTAENTIQQRNNSFRINQNKSIPLAKSVKFATSPDTTVGGAEEAPLSRRNSAKPRLNNILLKHKNTLNINTVHSTVKEIERLEKEENLQNSEEPNKIKISLSVATSPTMSASGKMFRPLTAKNFENRNIDPNEIIKNVEKVKNMIELHMESVEKTIQEDIYMRKRVQENKPLVSMQRVSGGQFLKISNELAKSTMNLSIKSEGLRKKWDFHQLVKGAQVLTKKVGVQEPSKADL